MPVYDSFDQLSGMQYRQLREPVELRVGLLQNAQRVARGYTAGVPRANACVIEARPFRVRVYPIEIIQQRRGP